MRTFALPAMLCAATVGTTSALVDARQRTTVVVEAVAYDDRTTGVGCSPDGCLAENTRDNDPSPNSRWQCSGNIITGPGGCRINYNFAEPQDVVSLRIAFHEGTERTLTLNVMVDGELYTQITSSGTSNGYQNFDLYTTETSDISLNHEDFATRTDEWVSLTEVRIMVE